MKIKDLFSKDIFRSINGVVKADQLDSASVWQELDEFVITKELHKHFDRFFDVYAGAVDQPGDADISGSIGIWVSGFFGSGKSHFIKALSYLFGNREIEAHGNRKKPLEFFEDKIDDAMLLGTVRRVVAKDTDVILFNIDSKADQSGSRDAILSVFLKVLNELQGYSPDHPHIAHMERYLEERGKLEAFRTAFRELTGSDWCDQRDSYMYNQDETVSALSRALGQSEEACSRWIDHAETDFSLTVENFSKWVKEYIDSRGPEQRIFFFVDEIGQFIGQDVHLMLNLQTIIENLGVCCAGRAWVVVTSQEDIDRVVGSLSNTQMNDFSKIQGRFKTRLSLSSANTDEVIQRRILEKKQEVVNKLEDLYRNNADILKNQLSFSNTGMTLTSYNTEDDFVRNYPFIPYQFKLIQKVFETIRRAGATGLHLSRGERSMLEAFQYAGQTASGRELGALVPFYWFYPSIESFLDTAVKRTIVQASENTTLSEYDVLMLQTLFMIRYIDEVKGSIDNLVTLSVDSIDADKFTIRSKIEESLRRLEKETLIGKSGENYFFLTNEEQDVSREIKSVELDSGLESRQLGTILFEDIYKDTKKHRYLKTGKDFSINRLSDKHPVGSRIEQDLTVSVITPFYDDYGLFDPLRTTHESRAENGCIVIKLPDSRVLANELPVYLKTEKYISRKNDENREVARILRDRKEENRDRKSRIIDTVREALTDADCYVSGQKLETDPDPLKTLGKACDYLIDNTFTKMGYIEHYSNNPQAEVQAVLRGDKILAHNTKALDEVREYIDHCTIASRQIVMEELVDTRYANRPFGWPEWESVLLLSRMAAAGEIHLVMNNNPIEKKRIYEIISKTSNWRKVMVRQRKVVDNRLLESLRKLGQELFGEMGPDSEDGLFTFLSEKFADWDSRLKQYKTLADTGQYPGRVEIDNGILLISSLMSVKESFQFMTRLDEIKGDLCDFSEDFHDIDTFYKTQRPSWERLQNSYARFRLNSYELRKDDDALKSLVRMNEIKESSAPYRLISEIDTHIIRVNETNEKLVDDSCKSAVLVIDTLIDELDREAQKLKQDKECIQSICKPLLDLKEETRKHEIIAHIQQVEARARSLFDTQVKELLKRALKPGEVPAIKKVREIRAGTVTGKQYLETQDDVKDFLDGIKKEIDEAIKSGHRIRIV